MSDLAVFLNYNFNQRLKVTGDALALANGHLTVINVKTMGLWASIKLWWSVQWSGTTFDKMKITQFIAQHKNEWQTEVAHDHAQQVAFEKQCIKIAKFKYSYRYYSAPYDYLDKPIKSFLENIDTLVAIGTWNMHVKIEYPYSSVSPGTNLEDSSRVWKIDRFTKQEDLNLRLLAVIHAVTGLDRNEPGSKYNISIGSKYDISEVKTSPIHGYAGIEARYYKDEEKGGDRLVEIKLSKVPQRM